MSDTEREAAIRELVGTWYRDGEEDNILFLLTRLDAARRERDEARAELNDCEDVRQTVLEEIIQLLATYPPQEEA